VLEFSNCKNYAEEWGDDSTRGFKRGFSKMRLGLSLLSLFVVASATERPA
jgi:hypothetical protein